MIQFVNPIAGSIITNIPGSKSVNIMANYGSPIVSPYNGVVSDINNDDVTISHNINNQIVYSKFSGINRPQVGINVPLKQGESFAYCDSTDIKYTILDDNGGKMNVGPFFNGIDDGTSKPSDEKEKEPKKTSEDEFGKDPKPNKSYISDFLAHLALKPFDVIHNKIRPKTSSEKQKEKEDKDKKESEKQKVNEEINRIKQLLK